MHEKDEQPDDLPDRLDEWLKKLPRPPNAYQPPPSPAPRRKSDFPYNCFVCFLLLVGVLLLVGAILLAQCSKQLSGL